MKNTLAQEAAARAYHYCVQLCMTTHESLLFIHGQTNNARLGPRKTNLLMRARGRTCSIRIPHLFALSRHSYYYLFGRRAVAFQFKKSKQKVGEMRSVIYWVIAFESPLDWKLNGLKRTADKTNLLCVCCLPIK